ncbi:MAG: hypothetical protein PF636_10475 [Actinomycetota bacterium]|jgi:hypothetical protein|nr:hypothetical protein [Actinomycetota bacterium]
MAVFIKTNLDPEGRIVRVERGFKGANGKFFLLLHRLPPEYAKPPTFIVELSGDKVEVRGGSQAEGPIFYKAYAIQDFTTPEKKFLARAKPGKDVTPFFNFSYPAVLRVLGKKFRCLSETELKSMMAANHWKLIGGQR